MIKLVRARRMDDYGFQRRWVLLIFGMKVWSWPRG